MLYISTVEVGGWGELLDHWWQWVLVALSLASIAVGSLYLVVVIVRRTAHRYMSNGGPSKQVVTKAIEHLQKYTLDSDELFSARQQRSKPASFGVYLGPFDPTPTESQIDILSSKEILLLDPFQRNVTNAIAGAPANATRFIGRIDLRNICKMEDFLVDTRKSYLASLDTIMNVVLPRFQRSSSHRSFDGILVAGWELFPVQILSKFCSVLSSLVSDVYLETSAPDFLQDTGVIAPESVSGLVIRNALILGAGDRRDCFNMENLKLTIKAFVSQSCMRDFAVFAWETCDDNVPLPSAVLNRTYNWCNFYSVIPWIGPNSALYDATVDVVPFEPLRAFDWLKDNRVMELHELWKRQNPVQISNNHQPALPYVVDFASKPATQQLPNSCHHTSFEPSSLATSSPSKDLDWFTFKDSIIDDPLCVSSSGASYNGIGCFPLGVDVSAEDFQEIVFAQRNLRKLELLDSKSPSKLRKYGVLFSNFIAESNVMKETTQLGTPCRHGAIEDLARILNQSSENGSEGIRIYLGLHSGFQRSMKKQFWGVYLAHRNMTDIFISKNSEDLHGTILHTFLSSRGFSRRQCMAAELSFTRWKGNLVQPYETTPRTVQDIDLLSPEDSIHLLQRVSLVSHAEKDIILNSIRSIILERLIEFPTLEQLRNINTIGYLDGSISINEVVTSRIRWHCQYKRSHPDTASAITLFKEVDSSIRHALFTKDRHYLQSIINNLETCLRTSTIDAASDMFALAVFCTMRKLAFEEVYIEVTDRNPLFNDQSDQAAAFAELFALGSRCEAYFDVSPSQFGKLLAIKYQNHYGGENNQPPAYKESQEALSSAYSEAQIDVDPKHKSEEMPAYQRFTFLSVFAIPALLDILMLTMTGHGLYLSGSPFMSDEEQYSATIALMIALILSGAIGTWITCGGTYYLASMAFSAMNYFVATRLLGGFAFIFIAALIGFIAFICTTTPHAAIVFLLYFIVLTTYLCLLAALANYQFIGSAFQSGRMIIILCIPVLFISPVTTIFVGHHDIEIYLTVLFVFVTLLLMGVRHTGSRWTTWYQKIELVKDQTLRDWYIEKRIDKSRETLEKLSDPAILKLARQALLQDVLNEQKKAFFQKATNDKLVLKLVKCYPATVFLMDWYCRLSGVAKPIMYSSSWNMQSKVALDTLQKSQLGIRFHNGFIHWRQAGDEIGCTMLYFIVALLDRWISLINGGQVTGFLADPTASSSPSQPSFSLRMPVGFGLAYYLIGAVLLDFNAQKLHELASQSEHGIVPTDKDLKIAIEAKASARKRVYWKTLKRYLCWHAWSLAATSILLWVFSLKSQGPGTIVFISYVGAYTGLLWYQYTKIFCGPHALKPLLIGVFIGLPVGFLLRHFFPGFLYSEIIGLATATWTVAILSLWAGRILGPPEDQIRHSSASQTTYHAYSAPGPDESWSQQELQGLLEKVTDLPQIERLHIDPKSAFGIQIKQILTHCSFIKLSDLEKSAFPHSDTLLDLTRKLFDEEKIQVNLVSLDNFEGFGDSMRAISSIRGDALKLTVGCETKDITEYQDPLPIYQQDVGELLVRAVAERYLHYSARDATLIWNLWSSNRTWTNETVIPSFMERQLSVMNEDGKFSELIDTLQKQLMQDLCLGINCDLDWESLPLDLRQYLIDRSLGVVSPLSASQVGILNEKIMNDSAIDLETYIARCNYAVLTCSNDIKYVTAWINGNTSLAISASNTSRKSNKILVDFLAHASTPPKYSTSDKVVKYCGDVYHYIGKLSKFFSIAFVADPEYQREVKYAFPKKSHILNAICRGVLVAIWMWAKFIQQLFLPFFLFHHRNNVLAVWKNLQGMEVSFKRRRVLIRNLDGVYTGFLHTVDSASFKFLQYRGDHKVEPENDTDLVAINLYSKRMELLRRVELNKGNTVNDYEYEYRQPDPNVSRRISKSDILSSPITRKGIAGQNAVQNVNYNYKGQIDSGSYIQDGNLVRFQYHYQKSARHSGALLRAEFVLPLMSCTVSWCAAPRKRPERLENWIPHSQVTEATFVVGADVWESKYFYDHKFHPTILTTLNGQRVDTPPLILYDHINVLRKPKNVSILDDNPLFSFNSPKSNPVSRWLGLASRYYPVSTSQSRSLLWKAWKNDPGFDGVLTRWLDERLLRRDPVLDPYWRKRDLSELGKAEKYLDDNRDAVMACVDLDAAISSWTPLAIKINDLHSFGQGGDACGRTRSNVTTQESDAGALHVIAVDTGTWPNEGGGVSACRSDVINNLKTIKWHMVAESANDFGIPKRQIEKNIQSLKVIPLWGLDLLTPTHGLFENRLDSQVEHITTHTTLLEIERAFVPILEAMIKGARALDFTMSNLKQVTRALVNLNTYFKDSRHWSEVWRSDVVKAAWRKGWLSQTMGNARPSSQWLKAELPTLGQLDQGLELWSRYLFIFSIPIPEQMPAVFQASHHSVSASYGVVCKIKRGCTLQIWDHAISWRETNLYLSSALCPLSPFVRNSLLGLMRMTSVLILHHADTILPCADFFNANWEVEIGTCQGKIEHRSTFKRKIDPVVNGITNMERFAPVKEIKSELPTVTMLSHIWFAKDIKTALLASDIIINQWGFKDYRLEIYGALDKSPTYTTNCQEIIATKSLRHQVSLCGEADPIKVLERTWVFLNSSVSEGLPLALGEAALTGAPVVCTDVGASLRVLTNPVDKSCYSAVVAPNDALAMARAQIKILALLEEWDKYADTNAPTTDSSFPDNPSPRDVERITRRMYEQADARRKLGMKSREIVQKSFSGDRYLREHEQMLWIGKARNDMANVSSSSQASRSVLAPQPVRLPNRMGGLVTPVSHTPRESILQRSSVQGSSTLPSLVFGTTSTLPSSLVSSESVPSMIGSLTVAEEEWLKKPEAVKVKLVNLASGVGLRDGRNVSGLSAEVMV